VSEPVVTLWTTGPACRLCEEAKRELERLGGLFAFRLDVVDLRERPNRDYALRAPVVAVGGAVVAEGRIPAGALEAALRAAGTPVRPARGVGRG
jgi:hypothetical protein